MLGWLVLPGAAALLDACQHRHPAAAGIFQLIFRLVRRGSRSKLQPARDAVDAAFHHDVPIVLLLTLTFLAHQMLLSVDAVVRSLVRRMVTGRRLLEWETAEEAEVAKERRSPADIYLNWVPVIAIGLGVIDLLCAPMRFYAAAPVLFCGPEQAGFRSG